MEPGDKVRVIANFTEHHFRIGAIVEYQGICSIDEFNSVPMFRALCEDDLNQHMRALVDDQNKDIIYSWAMDSLDFELIEEK